MKKGSDIVRYDIDLAKLPPLTARQKQEIATIAARPDEDIDYSDISAEDAALALYRPLKKQITTRLDADVLDWLKSKGSGYQGRINAILRREMLQSLRARRT
jgi:uncharacterized protein (DUF4415 family)